MSDFDEYFTDDIVFDEQTLAVLDHEEKKYQTQLVESTPPLPWRLTKRQKIGNGWKARPGNSSSRFDETDELPEISVQADGSYGVGGTIRVSSKSVTDRRREQPMTHTSPPFYAPAPRVPRQEQTSYNILSVVQIPHSSGDTPPTLHHDAASEIPQFGLLPHALQQHDSPPKLQKQLEELQEKLEQVSKENARIQAALKDATSARMTKEGEIAVLRRGIERSAKEHTARLVKLKAEKEDANAKHLRIQKEMREEVERMKTQVIFKNHEQESSHKILSSALAKNISKEPLTLTATPQLRTWDHHSASIAPRHSHVEVTPVPLLDPENIKDVRATTRNSLLPGFQNTFHDTTPPRASQKRSYKGKRNETEASASNALLRPASPYSRSHHSLDVGTDVRLEGLPSDDEGSHATRIVDDIKIFGENPQIEVSGVELTHFDEIGSNVGVPAETQSTELFRQKTELNRILLSHSTPSCASLTIHALLGATVIATLPPEISATYSASCTRIFEVIANTSEFSDWHHSIKSISQAFVAMIPILRIANLLSTLAALLNLLAILVYSFPDFVSPLLSKSHDVQTTESHVLVTMCELFLDQREIPKIVHNNLIAEIITFLEALYFHADDAIIETLVYIPRDRQVLVNLLHSNQPSWLLVRIIRFFVVLASYRRICWTLLSMPDPGLMFEERPPEYTKIPLIERLCLLLVDFSRKDAEFKQLKMLILTFFSLLSTSQPDVHVHLLTSTAVIPSMILFLSQLTTAFWEDDEDLISASPSEISLSIRTLNQTLLFLHYLVFKSVSFLNLRQKICVPQHRIFNGLMHTFIVTFGRLSYGEAPEWLDDQGRSELVSLTEMARDILDHVVDGPEADRTWQTYQNEPDAASETDEEEMEARLLGDWI